jgi:hypothetical protein
VGFYVNAAKGIVIVMIIMSVTRSVMISCPHLTRPRISPQTSALPLERADEGDYQQAIDITRSTSIAARQGHLPAA